jgi:hypothetical protein
MRLMAGYCVFLFFIVFVHGVFVASLMGYRDRVPLRINVSPPKSLAWVTFGYSEVLADLLWLRSLQDFDFCSEPQGVGGGGYTICRDHSWLFDQLDRVTDLSPSFRMPFSAGPLALSVLITDIEGATNLFKKAVVSFPKDWPIHYRAAYHAMIEEKKPLKAANLLKIAYENGGPQWLSALAGRMYVEGGAIQLGLNLAQSLEAGSDEHSQKLAERIRERIRAETEKN